MPVECLFQQRDALWAFPGTRKRNPEIFPTRVVKLLEVSQHRSTGNRPDVATPAPAKQGSERSAGVVRRARANEINCWRRCAAAADSCATQDVIQFAATLDAPLVSLVPRVRLLPDFTWRVQQPAVGLLLLR